MFFIINVINIIEHHWKFQFLLDCSIILFNTIISFIKPILVLGVFQMWRVTKLRYHFVPVGQAGWREVFIKVQIILPWNTTWGQLLGVFNKGQQLKSQCGHNTSSKTIAMNSQSSSRFGIITSTAATSTPSNLPPPPTSSAPLPPQL